jgi:peptide deformylase
MPGEVVLYFEDPSDALRFALAAGSVMAGEGAKSVNDLAQETARASRVRIDTANSGSGKKANSAVA